jgi:hypothetical protein
MIFQTLIRCNYAIRIKKRLPEMEGVVKLNDQTYSCTTGWNSLHL